MPNRLRITGRAAGLFAALCLAAGALLAAAPAGPAAGDRDGLANQYEWGRKTGFYLSFENESEGNAPCALDKLRLILGVADGKQWRFIHAAPTWEYGRDYTAKALVGPKGAEMWLDGEKVGASEGGFLPDAGSVVINHVPGYASGPTEYMILPSRLILSAGAEKPVDLSFAKEAGRQAALLLFEPQFVRHLPWTAGAEETRTVTSTFRIVRVPKVRDLAPFIDRYGQCRYADWPGKVRTDAELQASAAEEKRRLDALGAPTGYDRYGGFEEAGWREKATGFYRLVKRDGTWWLVTPEGNPCFYLGMCTAPSPGWETTPVSGREFLYEWLPPREGPLAGAWSRNHWGAQDGTEYVAFHSANMARKYGADWQQRNEEATTRRLKAWGFSGIAKWGGQDGLPRMPVLNRSGVPNVARHPDVFDPAVQAKFRDVLREQIEPRKKDPWVVGGWRGNAYGELITRAEVGDILKRPAAVPAKRVLVEHVLDEIYGGDAAKMAGAWGVEAKTREDLHGAQGKPPAADIEAMRCFYADAYYRFVYRTVKEIDPNHLYLGFWIVPGWWENEQDWMLIAPHCDAIGYDRYSNEFADARLTRLIEKTDKPILCGEYSYPSWYGGARGYGLYGTWGEDDADAGDRYTRWVEAAARSPYCVGVCWFHYRDQPLTGRGPGRGEALVYGEHYAFGVVDVTDRPKWDLVTRMREANLSAPGWRLKAAAERR